MRLTTRLREGLRHGRRAALGVLAVAGAVAAQPPPAQLILSPVEAPDNTPRLAHSGPYTVPFTVTNTGPGPDDAQVAYQCVATGNVTITSCPFNSIIPPQGDPDGNSVVVNVSSWSATPGPVRCGSTPRW
jgi:hypothetical protein